MKLIHTSPNEITKIEKHGLFGDALFFSSSRYVMTQNDTVHTYSIELDEEKTISVSELFSREIIKEIIEDLEELELSEDMDEELAEKLLDGRCLISDLAPYDAVDYSPYSEYEWQIQRYQGECAKLMGFEACSSTDEQGQVFIVPMLGRESDLVLVDVERR